MQVANIRGKVRKEEELHRDTVAANRTIGQQGKTKEGGGLKAIQFYI